MKKYVFIFFTAIFLYGCVTQTKLVKKSDNVSSNKGIILASVTKNGGVDGVNSLFIFKKEDEGGERIMSAIGTAWYKITDDYPLDSSKQGRLLAFEVNPGKYYLTNWQLTVTSAFGGKYIEPKEDPEALEFNIEAGNITYIGNLHIEAIYGKSLIGTTVEVSAKPSITNRAEIDLKLLNKKYPNLSDWPIIEEVPDTSKWQL